MLQLQTDVVTNSQLKLVADFLDRCLPENERPDYVYMMGERGKGEVEYFCS